MRSDIFAEIDAKSLDALGQCFGRIEAIRAQLPHAGQAWSLAELNSSERDYLWLVEWLGMQRRGFIESAISAWRTDLDPLHKHKNSVVTGTVLWLIFAEHVRRRGTEGNFWNALGSLPWHGSVSGLFFLQDGNPSVVIREILQTAAEAMRLRNVFGVEGKMPWFDTGYLQFGFTRTGFERRLPEWLAGQTPTHSVRHLIGLAGQSIASGTFLDLWRKLYDYRRQNLSEPTLRSFLRTSPWVLPAWTDGIVKCARERMSLEGTFVLTSDDNALTFLDLPRLEWTAGHSPLFSAAWINLDAFVLPAPTYVVRWGGHELGRLLRQADGSFIATTGPRVIFDWVQPRGVVTIESLTDGQVGASQPMVLWDETELVNLYDARGLRCEEAYNTRISTRDSYALCVPQFAKLVGPLAGMWSIPQQAFSFARIAAGAQRIALAADGEELWTSDYLLRPAPALAPGGVTISLAPPSSPLRFLPGMAAPQARLSVDVASGVELRWVRWGEQVTLPVRPGDYQIQLQPQHLLWPVTVTLGLKQDGVAFQSRHRVEVPFAGTLWRAAGKVRVLEASKLLGVRTALGDEFRIRLPNASSEDYKNHFLVEAGSIIRRVGEHAAPVGQLAGYGGPLVVRKGPYNEASDALTVASQVVDCGLVRTVDITSNLIKIQLIQEVSLRAEHAVVIWNDRHELRKVTPTPGPYSTQWEVSHHKEHGAIYAIGVFFNGVRVGAWFHLESWSFNLRSVATPSQIANAAVALRWFHAPILAESHVENIRGFVRRYPAAVLTEWLAEELRLCCGFQFAALTLDSAWSSALEELSGRGGLVLNETQAYDLFVGMNPSADLTDCDDAVARLVVRLTQISPQLAVSFVREFLDKTMAMRSGPAAVKALKEHLRQRLQPTPVQWQDLSRNVLKVVDEFLDNLAQKAINTRLPRAISDRNNLQMLSKHPAFRRYCAAKML